MRQLCTREREQHPNFETILGGRGKTSFIIAPCTPLWFKRSAKISGNIRVYAVLKVGCAIFVA